MCAFKWSPPSWGHTSQLAVPHAPRWLQSPGKKGTQVTWNTAVPALSLPNFQLCSTELSCLLAFPSVSSHLSLHCCIWHGLQRSFLGGCTNNVHISSGDSDSTYGGALALCPALLTSKESQGGEESPLGALPRKDSASQICLESSHSFTHPVNIC